MPLRSPVPAQLADEFQKKLSYVSEFAFAYRLDPSTRASVIFELDPDHRHEQAAVASRIVEVAEKLCGGYRGDAPAVLVSKLHEPSFREDPHPALEHMDELHRYGDGCFGFGPRILELMRLFDQDVEDLAHRLRAVPHQFPTLIGAEVLDRCRYIRSFPSALTMVSHLRADLEAIKSFARTAAWNGRNLEYDPESLSDIQCLLAPSVCFHYYAWLRGRSIPNRCITALGKCFRFEAANMRGLERLWDFTMREVVFAGTAQFALDQRSRVVEESVPLLDRWGLSYEIKSATDPFFIDDYATMAPFQLAFQLKFEVVAPLPYRGTDLAIGSFNYHQDFFGRSLAISADAGEAVHTSCAGFGLERVVLAFLAQHGLDKQNWPAAIAARARQW